MFDPSRYEDYRFGGSIIGEWDKSDSTQFTIRTTLEDNIHNHYDGSNPKRTFEAYSASCTATVSTKISSDWHNTFALGYERFIPIETYQWSNPNDPKNNELHSSIGIPTWQISTRYDLDKHSMANVSVGSKVKMPSLNQYFAFMPWETINVNLKPEISYSWDAGYEHRLENSLWKAALFYYDVNDKINYNDATSTYYNIDHVSIKGIQLDSTININATNRVIAHYVFTDAKDDTNHWIDYSPPHKALLSYQVEPLAHWTIDSLINYNSKSYFHDAQASAQVLNSYTTLDVKVSYTKEHLTIIGGILNLTDSNYQSSWGYPQMGRVPYFALKWNF